MKKSLFILVSFGILGCNLNSNKFSMLANKNLIQDEKAIDFRNFIRWDNKILMKINNNNSWTKFADFNIENAIKYIPNQGHYGSCTVNSSARALVLMNVIVIKYDEFLKHAKLYASASLKYQKKLSNQMSQNMFYSLVKLQEDLYKDNKEVTDNILKECFENGSSFFQISKFINHYCDYIQADSKCFSDFKNCFIAIKNNINKGLGLIGSFRSGKTDNNGKISSHAMNIIGYNNKEFLILNTWGGNKVQGILSFGDMDSCMNINGYYYLMIFKKKM